MTIIINGTLIIESKNLTRICKQGTDDLDNDKTIIYNQLEIQSWSDEELQEEFMTMFPNNFYNYYNIFLTVESLPYILKYKCSISNLDTLTKGRHSIQINPNNVFSLEII